MFNAAAADGRNHHSSFKHEAKPFYSHPAETMRWNHCSRPLRTHFAWTDPNWIEIGPPDPIRSLKAAFPLTQAARADLPLLLLGVHGGDGIQDQGILLGIWEKHFGQGRGVSGNADNGNGNLRVNGGNVSTTCGVHGCKAKAMALTRFCGMQTLSDAKQKLTRLAHSP